MIRTVFTVFLVLVSASMANAGSSVKGIVVGPDGESFSGGRVLLLNPVDQKVFYETSVVQGAFRIEPVAAQSYFISIQALGFREHADSVSVVQDQAVDMGRITLNLGFGVISSRWQNKWDVIGRPPSVPEPEYVDAHIRSVIGYPVMTVCEYLKLRSAVPISYGGGAIIIGMLVETPQGRWLQQTCRDSLRSGNYSWPNAIALEEYPGSKIIAGSCGWKDFLPYLIRPSNEELDPKDREGRWVAFLGRLQTGGNLVVVPCGDGMQCAYGYGAISAPALLQYQHSYDFSGTKSLDTHLLLQDLQRICKCEAKKLWVSTISRFRALR